MNNPRPVDRTELDFEALLELSSRKAEETRRACAAVTAALFEARDGMLTDRQRALMTNLLRKLVSDIDSAVRRSLLRRIEERPEAAEGRLFTIADEAGMHAFERMAAAGLLADADLIETVLHRMLQHQLERAIRRPARAGWTDAPAFDEGRVLDALIGDANGRIRERLNAYLVERAQRMDAYGDPVLQLCDLPDDLVRRLHWQVAAILRQAMRSAVRSNGGVLDELMEGAVHEALAALAEQAARPSGTAAVVEALDAAGLTSCALLVEAARQGEIPLFEALFARLSGLRPVLVRRLLYEPGGEGLAIAARAVGMDAALFADLYALARQARLKAHADANGEVLQAVALFERIPQGEAAKVCAYWRRNLDYLTALRRLGRGA